MKNVCITLLVLFMMVSCKKDETDVASIKTIDINLLDNNKIDCHGIILNSGSTPIFTKGFCWSTDSLSDISKCNFQTVNTTNVTFDLRIENLLPQTKYYIAAFGTNKSGTFYGNILSLKTASNMKSHFTDNRDNRTYKTVYIKDIEWMAENLSFSSMNSNFYNNDSINYSRYGRLYSWNSALNACPSGWKLPSDDDWMKLEAATGMTIDEITDSHIRGWEADQLLENGIQSFNAMLINDYQSFFWTSTNEENGVYYRGFMLGQKGITRATEDSTNRYSVRCIRQ